MVFHREKREMLYIVLYFIVFSLNSSACFLVECMFGGFERLVDAAAKHSRLTVRWPLPV